MHFTDIHRHLVINRIQIQGNSSSNRRRRQGLEVIAVIVVVVAHKPI